MARDAGLRRVVGKRYWREADACLVVDAWRASGETQRAFSRRHGVDAGRLARWARRLNPPDRPAVDFPPHLELVLRDDVRVRVGRGFDAEDLRRLLGVLEEAVRC
jgi:hypothetical protein